MVTSSENKLLLPVSKHLVGLDAIRVFACLIVVAVHTGFSMWAKGTNTQGVPTHAFDVVQPYVVFGWVGVEIFFVLSGFVIAYSAYSSPPGRFMLQRVTRLMPALVLCTTFTGAVLFSVHAYAPRALLRMWLHSVFFYPKLGLMDASHWTLSLEMSFYTLVFLVLLCGRTEWLARVIALLGIVGTLMDVCLVARRHLSPGASVYLVTAFQKIPYNQGHFLRHGCYFSLGVFLWLALFRAVTWQRLAMIAVCLLGGASEIIQRAREISSECQTHVSGAVPLLVWLASLLAILACVRFNVQMQHLLGSKGVAILRSLGLITYPLYLVHQAFGKVMIVFLIPWLGGPQAVALTLLVTFALATMLALRIEPPLQRLMRTNLPKLNPAPALSLAAGNLSLMWERALQPGAVTPETETT